MLTLTSCSHTSRETLLADDCEQTAWREEYGCQHDMTKKVLEGEHMSETIGFIGLGDLGQPIACNLLAAGYALKVYNRTASKAEPLVAQGAQQVFQPRDVLTRGGIVVSVVWDDAALESIV